MWKTEDSRRTVSKWAANFAEENVLTSSRILSCDGGLVFYIELVGCVDYYSYGGHNFEWNVVQAKIYSDT